MIKIDFARFISGHQYIDISDFNDWKERIQNQKSNIQIISVLYEREGIQYTPDQNYDTMEREFGFKVFDSQKMIHRLLKFEYQYQQQYLQQNQNINIEIILSSIENQLSLNDQNIIELEKLSQMWYEWEIQIYDATILQNKDNYIVYEIENLQLPLDIFLNFVSQENSNLISKIKRKFEYYLQLKYLKQHLTISLKNYYVQINQQDEIKIKSIVNINQEIIYQPKVKDKDYYHHIKIQQELEKRIKQISDQKIQESLSRQLETVQEKLRIQKQNLSSVIGILAPKILEENFHCKEIFKTLDQHPKYNSYSLIDFNQDYFILKAYDAIKKYQLKLEKFDSSYQANIQKQKFELLRKQQSEQQGVFLDIGDCDVICVEKWWYVLLEENYSVKQQRYKLIPLQQIDRIQQYFSKIDCSQYYIQMYLIIRNLKHYESILKLGFSKNELFGCVPYISIINLDQISSNEIIFSNPYFLSSKQQPQSILENQFIDIFQSIFYDESIYSCFQNFKRHLKSYLQYQENIKSKSFRLDEIQTKFPKLNYMIDQIYQIIKIVEQFSHLLNNDYYINNEFDIILSFDNNNFLEKRDIYNQITQLQIQQFDCTFLELQTTYLKYLTEHNKINKLFIKNHQQKIDDQFKGGHSLDFVTLKNERQNNFDKVFQNLKELQIECSCDNLFDINVNQLQNLKLIKNIKIYFQRQNIQFFKSLDQMKKIIEIFDHIKTFEVIEIDFYYLRDREFYEKFQIQNDVKQDNKAIVNAQNNIYQYFLLYNQQDSYFAQSFFKDLQVFSDKNIFLNYESSIIEVEDEEEVDILSLKFYDNCQLGFNEIEIFLKLKYENTFYLSIQSLNYKNQQRMRCYSNVFQDLYGRNDQFYINWFLNRYIRAEVESYYLKQLIGTVPICNCYDSNQLASRIYKNQTQLKSLTLYINRYIDCYKKSIMNVCDELGLTQGTHFQYLHEIIFQFFYIQISHHKPDNGIFKYLFKIINKNQSVNTLIFHDRFPKMMFKLKRIVKLEEIYY